MMTQIVPRTQNNAALEQRATDGGGAARQPSAAYQDRGPQPPMLPAGFAAQPVWGFLGEGGRHRYEFNNVYAQARISTTQGPICQMDENLSFWAVSWQHQRAQGPEYRTVRWLTFAEAKLRMGPALTFSRFSSLPVMRHALASLLGAGGADVRA